MKMYNGEEVKGIWDNIPEYQEFTDRGFKCHIRKSNLGHLCGYVKLPQEILHGELDIYDLDVHGGITYTHGNIIGFDCSHFMDYTPALQNTFVGVENYHDEVYVKNELKGLVNQLIRYNEEEL